MSLARRVGRARRQFHRLLESAPIGRPKNRRIARNERHCFAPTGRGVADFVQISLGREIVDSDYRLYSADDLFGPAWVRRELVTDAPVLAGPVYRLRGRLARGPASKQSSDRRNDLRLRPVSSARSGPRALMIACRAKTGFLRTGTGRVHLSNNFLPIWLLICNELEHRGRREVGPYSAAAQNAPPEPAVGRTRFGAPPDGGTEAVHAEIGPPFAGFFLVTHGHSVDPGVGDAIAEGLRQGRVRLRHRDAAVLLAWAGRNLF